jgi:hypothetical protein
MPAKSEKQRKFLNWKFGHKWVKNHHFDNPGKLPKKVKKEEALTARAMFGRLQERDDAPSLPLGKAGHAYSRMDKSDIMEQPGGTSKKWHKSVALRKEVTNQQDVKGFPSMDKVGKVPHAMKEALTSAQVVSAMLD